MRESIDGNGIDLFLGTFNVNAPALTIGASQGLSYYKLSRGGGWFDNLTGSMDLTGTTMTVILGGKTDTFTVSGSTYTPTEGNGATLTYNGTTLVYTYTTSDGTVAHFNKNQATPFPYHASDGRVTDIISPSGEKLTFTYSSLHYCSQKTSSGLACAHWADAYRVSTVRNSYGYLMTLAYDDEYMWDPDDIDLPDFNVWGTPLGVTASNLAASGGATPGQSFAVTTSGGDTLLTVTDAMSRATVFRSTAGVLMGVKLPGARARTRPSPTVPARCRRSPRRSARRRTLIAMRAGCAR
ncbi:MAG: hypothetical protein E7773_14640 [Sphingomonas sp.]|nr:MAG: hypothetical protein E7773_14640 [Sphingomonas sp.]